MGEVDAPALLEHLHGQVMLAAVADRGVEQRRLGAARECDEVAEIARGELGIGGQEQRVRHQARHRHEILERIDRHLGIEMRIDAEQRARAQQQRVAVRCRAGHQLAGEIAVRARPVLHHHRLAQTRRKRQPHGAGHQIGGAPGRIRHQEPDRPARIGLRPAGTRKGGIGAYGDQRRQHEPEQAGHDQARHGGALLRGGRSLGRNASRWKPQVPPAPRL